MVLMLNKLLKDKKSAEGGCISSACRKTCGTQHALVTKKCLYTYVLRVVGYVHFGYCLAAGKLGM